MADKESKFAVAHEVLDAGGFVQGPVGVVADLANAGLYLAEGDLGNAFLSAISAIPVIGDGIAAVNKARKVAKGANEVTNGLKSAGVVAKNSTKNAAKRGGSGVSSSGKMKDGARGSSGGPNKNNTTKKKKEENKKEKVEEQCFTGDTLILTSQGYRPVKEIQKGDDIYSRNEQTGETGLQKVTEVYKSEAYTIYHIWLDGKEEIKTTAYHPIFVEEEGWVSAINLKEGCLVATKEGTAQVTKITKVRHEEPVEVYNVHVDEWQSYFVSESQVYVHNCGEDTGGPYSHLDESRHSIGEGKEFTQAQKRKIIEENMRRNGGELRSDLSGELLYPATQCKKGELPEHFWEEVQIDHIFPKSKGGSNSFSNAQVLSRRENLMKSDK